MKDLLSPPFAAPPFSHGCQTDKDIWMNAGNRGLLELLKASCLVKPRKLSGGRRQTLLEDLFWHHFVYSIPSFTPSLTAAAVAAAAVVAAAAAVVVVPVLTMSRLPPRSLRPPPLPPQPSSLARPICTSAVAPPSP